MEKRRFLAPNIAIVAAAMMFASMFFFLKNMEAESFVPLIFAALILIAVDVMEIVVHPIATVVWSSIFAIIAMILTKQLSVGMFILLISGVVISIIVEKLSSFARDHILKDMLMLNVWGMLPYIFFSGFGGIWRLFVILGIGLVATIPIAIIKIISATRHVPQHEVIVDAK